MKRKIIKIDSDKCNGCGLCVDACHEGAIGMKNGKAVLLRDDYCDGLGDCLPVCPVNAISFEEREALAYNEEEVKRNQAAKKVVGEAGASLPCGCPSAHSKRIERVSEPKTSEESISSELCQWPVQIKLVPANAPYFNNARLLIAADCTAYAFGNFHKRFMRNRVVLIGCPKLDSGDYAEKLTDIIKNNNIKSVEIVRMQVPCCGGLEFAAKRALQDSGKFIEWKVYTISTSGEIVE